MSAERSTPSVPQSGSGRLVGLDVLYDGLTLEAAECGLSEALEDEVLDGLKPTTSVLLIDRRKLNDYRDICAEPGERLLGHVLSIQHLARYVNLERVVREVCECSCPDSRLMEALRGL